jgi:L-ascorbate metabolism protein UlaG (beta-lactamase superfamily)
MEARTLGWAGVQLRAGDSTIVIDPLLDTEALWAFSGDLARDVVNPPVVAPEPAGHAAAALVTHLHRDHADAGALAAALRPGAPVFGPELYGGEPLEELGVAQAGSELEREGVALRAVRFWETVEVDGWRCTALPAADGTGDAQVNWLVERDGASVVHAGDTLWHGWWWRIAQRAQGPIDLAFLPVNGARVSFPHRQPAVPLLACMDGRDAVIAATALGAVRMVPMHHSAYDLEPFYVSDADALGTVAAAAEEHGVAVHTPELGAWFAVEEPAAA